MVQTTLLGEKVSAKDKALSKKDDRNKLNDLTGKDWLKFTKSWFIFDALASDLKEEQRVTKDSKQHPATFSPTLIEEFIGFFTKKLAM